MKGRGTFALGFVALMVIGAIVLSSPFARVEGTWGDPLSAAFMACSAVCVTGLTVVDVAAEWTRAGQIALLALVQLGCLSLMTLGIFFMIAVGRRLSIASEFSLRNAYGTAGVKGLRALVAWTVVSMLAIEGAGALLLRHWTDGWYESVYYAIMGFCNAGFGLRAGSLATFADSPCAVLVMAAETILGGIGFLVIYNLCTFRFLRRSDGAKGRLTLHTRTVLRVTACLLAIGFAAFLALEWNGALAGCAPLKKLWIAFYQSVTPRTCGFTITPMETLRPLTRLVYEVLMFIGGAPGSAAAGLKVTTFAVIVCTMAAMCRGDTETVIDRRLISTEVVRESLVILLVMIALVTGVTGTLLFTEGGAISTDALFFEAVSAVTTTGLSIGSTTVQLSPAGKIILMAAMFAGRLGALTVVMMIGDRESPARIRYPNGELIVG